MKARATTCCTIQLGSISSLRCQKTRTSLSIQTSGCEVMFRGRFGYGSQSAARLRSYELRRAHFASSSCVAAPRAAEGEAWWAWEDLNFRPHAYQARALTN